MWYFKILYTCHSWVSIPKTQFVGLAYPIDFLGHSLTGTINYKTLLSQQTPKKLYKISDFFVLSNFLFLITSF